MKKIILICCLVLTILSGLAPAKAACEDLTARIILEGEIAEATTKNGVVDDDNLIEQNKKTVNAILLSAAANRYDTVTSADSTTLNQIAHQLAIQGGEAVYWARGKLKLDIIDHLPALRKAKPQQEQKYSKHGKLFPVPATERVTFSYDHLETQSVLITIADPVGQVLQSYLLMQNSIDFSVSNLATGFYYVKVCEDGVEKEEHKLTVIK